MYEGKRIGRVYALIDPETQVVRYVGKTVRALSVRLRAHVNDARLSLGRSNRRPLHRRSWIQSLQARDLEPEIVLLEEGEWTWEELNDCENAWIAHYRAIVPNLTNADWAGGNGGPNAGAAEFARQPWSDERRQRQSEATKRWHADRRAKGLKWDVKSEEGRRATGEKSKAWWDSLTPEERTAHTARTRTDDAIKKRRKTLATKRDERSKQQREYWSDPEVRARHSERQRAMWAAKKLNASE